MNLFLESYGGAIEQSLQGFDVSEFDRNCFRVICAFLDENPDALSWRGKHKPELRTEDGYRQIAQKFFDAKSRRTLPAPPKTVPDEVVSIVMRVVYGYSEQQTEQIKVEHQHSMSAENIVGLLLERYISEVMEPYGWVWCAGDFVKAVDFIRYVGGDKPWRAVQVKNRSNTENSSSGAVRQGTEILKWYRTKASTGESNWEGFPEPDFVELLSEEDFRAYVADYLQP